MSDQPTASAPATQKRLNTQLDLNSKMAEIYRFVCSDRNIEGITVPRFGVFSLLARRTPFYVYDHPAFKKICETAFTDGTHVYFDADFLRQLIAEDLASKTNGNQERSVLFLVLHELSHVLYRHHYRLSNFPRAIRLIATDLSINTRLRRDFTDMAPGPTLLGVGWGMKEDDIEKYAHLSEEAIARMLMEKAKDQQNKGNGGADADSEQGGDQHLNDNHVVSLQDVIEALNEAGLEHVIDLLKLPKNDADMKAHEQERLMKIIDDVQNASYQASRLGGKFPGKYSLECAEEMISGLSQPKLNFKNAIQEILCGDGMCYEYSMEEPGDIWHYDPTDMGFSPDGSVFLGTHIPAKPDSTILTLVDTSGSVDNEMLKLFFTEIAGTVHNRGNNIPRVVVLSADTALKGEPLILDAYDPDLLTRDYTVYGRGGTSIENSIREALDSDFLRNEKIKAILYFTDLLDAPPLRENLPEFLPPIHFITPPDYRTEIFTKAVEGFAQVTEIESGQEVDLEEPMGMST